MGCPKEPVGELHRAAKGCGGGLVPGHQGAETKDVNFPAATSCKGLPLVNWLLSQASDPKDNSSEERAISGEKKAVPPGSR